MECLIPCFDPLLIARSGQCFRMTVASPRVVVALAGCDRLRITVLGKGRFRLDCTEQRFLERWKPYFDLDENYEAIEAQAMAQDRSLCRAASACSGLRILRQDAWETLISFLISQRKSIKAIQTCIEKLCERYGQPMRSRKASYYAFPTAEALLQAGESGLRECGVGYRAPYLLCAARCMATGEMSLTALQGLTDNEALARLMTLNGVGIKVANCVLLFGFHRLARAPVDVWIERIITEEYGGISPFEGYGAYAGIFQQYLFLAKLDAQRGQRKKSS